MIFKYRIKCNAMKSDSIQVILVIQLSNWTHLTVWGSVTHKNSHIQKTDIWQETVVVVQRLHSNFGCSLYPSFFRLLDGFSEDRTSHSHSAVRFVSQEYSSCLIRPWQAPFMLFILGLKKGLKLDQTHYFWDSGGTTGRTSVTVQL